MLSSQGSVGRAQVAGPSWQRALLAELIGRARWQSSVGRARWQGSVGRAQLAELVGRAR
ncbi:hypothetical protein DPMN_061962 [Dreissena polymorpha]|uniref:Uncharacterized protein n=1 Tax=Dreissena polymorpha TaxID=45954 RepID=A0A9D4C8Q4_DREPO|nr:hypothetical protein DPMN_061962 [Dreissena polymorpha]